MILKNLSLFRLARKIGVSDLNDLDKALRRRKHRVLGKMERVNDGFVPPMPSYRDDFLLYVGNRELDWVDDDGGFQRRPFPLMDFGHQREALVLMFYREEKVIVSQDIKRKVQDAVNEIEASQSRKVYAKERAELKDKFISEVMPHAQTRYWQAPVIFFSEGIVAVGEVGAKAEMVMHAVREILGTFPLHPLTFNFEVTSVLTRMAKIQAEDRNDEELYGFQVADDFQFQEPTEQPAVARMKRTDVADESVQHLMEGKVVTHANVLWSDKVTFKLDPKFALRKLKVLDSVFEEAEGGEDEQDLAGANYASVMIEFATFMDMMGHLAELFGGEEERSEGNVGIGGPDKEDEFTFISDIDGTLMRSFENTGRKPSGEEES